MGDQLDIDRVGPSFYYRLICVQLQEAQYNKEVRKREIEKLKQEFQELKAMGFRRKKGKQDGGVTGAAKETLKGNGPQINRAKGKGYIRPIKYYFSRIVGDYKNQKDNCVKDEVY